MHYLIVVMLLLYALLLWAFLRAWKKLPSEKKQTKGDISLISVIVPFRNEAKHLPQVWKRLQAQDNTGPVELIFVDDHSEDGGLEIIRKETENEVSIAVNITQLNKDERGKKAALQKGVAISSGDFLLFTDADVFHPPSWIRTMREALTESTQTHLCWGGIRIIGKERQIIFLQQLEYGILMLSGASSLALGFPLLSTGANLILRKPSLEALGKDPWHQELASGDDVFLVEKIWKQFGRESIRFVKSREALCETPGLMRWGDVYKQRLRWAGKSAKTNLKARLTGLAVVLANLAFLLSIGLLGFGKTGVAVPIICLLLKAIPEWMLAVAWTGWSGQRKALRAFPRMVFLYPVFLIFLWMGTLGGGASWKGRKIRVR
jgi:glycosyltransferase involved in cell wall biosynthesis